MGCSIKATIRLNAHPILVLYATPSNQTVDVWPAFIIFYYNFMGGNFGFERDAPVNPPLPPLKIMSELRFHHRNHLRLDSRYIIRPGKSRLEYLDIALTCLTDGGRLPSHLIWQASKPSPQIIKCSETAEHGYLALLLSPYFSSF